MSLQVFTPHPFLSGFQERNLRCGLGRQSVEIHGPLMCHSGRKVCLNQRVRMVEAGTSRVKRQVFWLMEEPPTLQQTL